MGFLEVYSASGIISQVCWLIQSVVCLLSLAAISVPPLLMLLCCSDYSSLPLCLPSFPHTCQIFLRIVFFRVSQLNMVLQLHHAGLGDACTSGLLLDELALGSQWGGTGTGCCWKHSTSSSTAVGCFTNWYWFSQLQHVSPGWKLWAVVQLRWSGTLPHNPACCLYPGKDRKQIFWQLSDTQIALPAPFHWVAQNQEPLLLLSRKNTIPFPGASHHRQAMHVCMVWTVM